MIFENEKIKIQISQICQKHKVTSLFAFGSSVRTDFNNKTSDIDLLVTLNFDNPVEKGEHLMELWNELEQLFEKKVDLIVNTSIKNPILLQEIESSKKLIYAA